MLQVLTSDYAHHVLRLLRSAVHTVSILSYVVNFNLYKRSDYVNLIYLELKQFVRSYGSVRIILDPPKFYKPNYHCNRFAARRFNEAGIDVRFLVSGSSQHAKLIVIDGLVAVFGSHNLTTRSVLNRYDISVISDDVRLVHFFSTYFNDLWQGSVER